MTSIRAPQADKAPGPTVDLYAATYTVRLADARICRNERVDYVHAYALPCILTHGWLDFVGDIVQLSPSFQWGIKSPTRRGWLADRLAKGERPCTPILVSATWVKQGGLVSTAPRVRPVSS
jgi:hypothetical protein